MTTLSAAFDAVDRPLLVGYLPAGFPTVTGAIDAIVAMVEAGVDAVEIGVPYSDPLMDGPVIQDAADTALRNGFKVRDVLTTVEAVAATGAPALVMTYWNPIVQWGEDAFARDFANAGGAGVITPDLLPDEAANWIAACRTSAIDPVFLVAPTSPEARIRSVAAASSGMIYAASTMGVTGVRTAIASGAPDLVARVKAVTSTPVGIGIGVSTAAQAAEVAAYADAVIVGSALVRALGDGGVAGVAALAGELAGGVRGTVPA